MLGQNPWHPQLATKLGYKIGLLLVVYLVMPLGMKHNSLEVWDRVEERFHRRFSLWKMHYISKGGRLTLIKSTLSNLPIYIMSLFLLPRIVKIRLEKICDTPNSAPGVRLGCLFFFFIFLFTINLLIHILLNI